MNGKAKNQYFTLENQNYLFFIKLKEAE